MAFLAGDVGGTKTLLALVEGGVILRQGQFQSPAHRGLSEMARAFLAPDGERAEGACFGVAGPVLDGVCRATNLPWLLDEGALARDLGLARVTLVNDFCALGVGVMRLKPADTVAILDAPSDPRGPWAVIGAGTGLGEAIVVRRGDGFEVLPSEGGHADFAPRDELEVDLWQFMRRRHAHVSWERLVSGPGLCALYDFFSEREGMGGSPEARREIARSADPPATIAARAAPDGDPACREALRLFLSLYGAEAGNLALKALPRGGVYVAGGIAPKNLAALLDGTFRRSFVDKGRMGALLERTPVRVVLNPAAGLLGAAAIAEGPAAGAQGRSITADFG